MVSLVDRYTDDERICVTKKNVIWYKKTEWKSIRIRCDLNCMRPKHFTIHKFYRGAKAKKDDTVGWRGMWYGVVIVLLFISLLLRTFLWWYCLTWSCYKSFIYFIWCVVGERKQQRYRYVWYKNILLNLLIVFYAYFLGISVHVLQFPHYFLLGGRSLHCVMFFSLLLFHYCRQFWFFLFPGEWMPFTSFVEYPPSQFLPSSLYGYLYSVFFRFTEYHRYSATTSDLPLFLPI